MDAVRIALVYPGDREARQRAAPEASRFWPLFRALEEHGARAEPAVYRDDFCGEVRDQLMQADAALVWVNPIQDGRDRSILDAMLREVAETGVFVSAHPDVIDRLATKEVLYRTRDLGWGSDTHLYRSPDRLRDELPGRLAVGPRVLKPLRGNGGRGVFKVEAGPGEAVSSASVVRVRGAERGSVEERIAFETLCRRCETSFAAGGGLIDQAYQPRLAEGMVRCYLVHDRVEGFGLQAINALYPPPAGGRAEDAPQPGPRLYHPPTLPPCQHLKTRLEEDWVPALQRRFDLATRRLPVLWDCDFLYGPKTSEGEDTYVLCEVNASSVAPFPESAVAPVARAALQRALEARAQKRS